MANIRKSIVYIHHDRHTDDHIETFPYSKENWELAKEKCRRDWGDATPGYASTGPGHCEVDSDTYFKWSWDGSGSYESSVQIVDRIRKPKLPKYNG